MLRIRAYLLSFVLFFCLFSSAQNIDWQNAQDIAVKTFGNNQPRVVADGEGNPLVIWGNSANLMFSRWDTDSFTTPVALNIDGVKIAQAVWMGPDIAAFNNLVYVVYKELPEGSPNSHIWLRKSSDGGKSFGTPVQVDQIADSLSRFSNITTDDVGNPIVAFMKFNTTFNEPRWVVARSYNQGMSFQSDILAGNWSSADAEACDCCPASLASSQNNLALVYRDNDNNIRDVWAGISTDTGNTFSFGADIDKGEWQIFSCPSSGPDAVIINDSLYTAFLSGSSGSYRAYFSRTALNDGSTSGAIRIKADFAGLSKQNFPRIANDEGTVAMVWQEVASGNNALMLNLSANITQSSSSLMETVATDNVSNGDVYLFNGQVFCVWQDNVSSTVKFRSGNYNSALSINEPIVLRAEIYPNPSNTAWNITSDNTDTSIELYDTQGRLVYKTTLIQGKAIIENQNLAAGSYTLKFSTETKTFSHKVIKF